MNGNFRERVEKLMGQVPLGQVTTYGDLAAFAGQAQAARAIGGIAHFGDIDLPWHRLVNRNGGLASGYHGGREAQAMALRQEGVTCTDFTVDEFQEKRWNPYR